MDTVQPDTPARPKNGTLLLAEPFMVDPNFKRSVVLLCENQESGSIGFILNRPLHIHLLELIDGIYVDFDPKVFAGGYLETDTLHFIHNVPSVPECVKVADGIYWGGDFEELKMMINKREVKADNFKFFLGYAGWDSKQIIDELNDKQWITHMAAARHAFESNPEELWKNILLEKGGDYKMMVNFPEDPQLN